MPILGIDFGAASTKLASVGRGGVTIVRNDLADRLTPTLVTYTDTERLVGDAALTCIKSNSNRTLRNFKNLVGCMVGAESTRIIENELPYALAPLTNPPGQTSHHTYNVGGHYGNVTALEAMVPFLKKLIAMGNAYIGAPITDVVIAVPSWFNDVQRSAVKDACTIAGVGCHSVMNHSTATALDYGLFRNSSFPKPGGETPHSVVFVDVGYASATVTLVDYTMGALDVIIVEEDTRLGGRALDRVLMDLVATNFIKKTGCQRDPRTNPKAFLKLEEACEKAKKVLSANKEANIHMECFFEDEDLDTTITRAEFEGLTAPYLEGLSRLCSQVMSRVNTRQLIAVEICGGGTRIPCVQALLSDVFKKSISKTVSADECVARGAAIQAAMLDPRHRVTQFQVKDRRWSPVLLTVETPTVAKQLLEEGNAHPMEGGNVTSRANTVVLLPEGTETGFIKCVQFPLPVAGTTNLNFVLTTIDKYTGSELSIGEYSLRLSEAAVDVVKHNPELGRLKVRFAVDENLAVQCEAHFFHDVVEKHTVSEKIPKLDEEGKEIPDAFDVVTKEKEATVVKRASVNVTVTKGKGYLNLSDVEALRNKEKALEQRDSAAVAARTLRNDILSTCFKLRGAASGTSSNEHQQFIGPADRELLLKECADCEAFVEQHDGLSVEEYRPYYDTLMAAWAPCQSRIDSFKAEEERKRKAAEELERERIRQEEAAAEKKRKEEAAAEKTAAVEEETSSA